MLSSFSPLPPIARCVLLLASTFLFAKASLANVEIQKASYRMGDDPSWSALELDESEWVDYSNNEVLSDTAPENRKVVWIRLTGNMSDLSKFGNLRYLYLSTGGKYEAYFNGRLLGTSRRFGNPTAHERNDLVSMNNRFALEQSELGDGKFVIALRAQGFESLSNINFLFVAGQNLGSYQTRLKVGNDKSWSEMGIDESEWIIPQSDAFKSVFSSDRPTEYWVRQQIYLNDDEKSHNKIFEVNFHGTYDLYWDGLYIGSNGVTGDSKNSETPGTTSLHTVIPTHLREAGPHTLAYHITVNYSRARIRKVPNAFPFGSMQTIESFKSWFSRSHRLDGISFSAMLIVGGFYLLSYIIYKHSIEYLAFALICFCMAASTALYQQFFGSKDYYQFWWNTEATLVVASVIGLLFPLFHLSQAKFSGKVISISLGIVAIVYVFSHSLTSTIGGHVMTVFYCITSIGIAVGIYALVRFRRVQDWLSFIATICLVAAFYKSGYNISYFVNYWIGIGFTYSCCFLLGALVFQMRSENKEKESYWIASAKLSAQKERLELELLKNSIQPHFLMNTLTSVMEWVEESPEKGIQFIDTLAGEFRHLYEISSKTLIPIEKELEVCRAFLSIMHYRKEVFYKLDTEGINSIDQVPPLVFHTLIENSISRGSHEKGQQVTFTLKQISSKNHRTYRFFAPMGSNAATAQNIGAGTGMKYIKARLEESYAGRWKLDGKQIGSSWITEIEIVNETKN